MAKVLGISAFYHDSAAALVVDGEIVAAAQEERFSRRKNDARFPQRAVGSCLELGGVTQGELDAVVFYDKPIVKFARMLETYLSVVPGGLGSFVGVLPGWLSEKLNVRDVVRKRLGGLGKGCEVMFTTHHGAHAASAYYPSGFERAAVLTVDGVGEWATTTVGRGYGERLEMLEELRFPHSLGLLYSAFTAYCGFRVNSGEYKLMGLAPYGEPSYAKVIRDELIEVRDDGSFRLNLEYFDFLKGGERMTGSRFDALMGGPPRELGDGELGRRFMDVARSVQEVTEEVVTGLARRAVEVAGERRLCMAGGVALNCVANGKLLGAGVCDELWVQPAAGDAGGALGAALCGAIELGDGRCVAGDGGDGMKGALLGPGPGEGPGFGERLAEEEVLERAVEMLGDGKVIGWCQGRMEFGPRALGNRSILADPRRVEMQSRINQSVKFREGFRPFAPAVLAGRAGEFFNLEGVSPYMLLVAPVAEGVRKATGAEEEGFGRLKVERSELPAVTHVDYSARVQTVDGEANPLFYRLIKRFGEVEGCPVLVNTSFNVRGEPVVCSAEDAVRCFARSGLDALFVGGVLVERGELPEGSECGEERKRSEFSDALEVALKEKRLEWVKFSASFGVMLGLLWALVLRGDSPAWWGLSAPLVLVVAALASRGWARWFYRTGMTVLMHVGHRVGKVLLGVVWLFFVVPIGVVMRLLRKDLLDVKDGGRWKRCEEATDLRKMF